MHANDAVGTTWIKRLRKAVAGLALAALALGGAVAVSAPDEPAADEQAGATWSR